MVKVLGRDLVLLDQQSALEFVGDQLNPNWLKLSQPALKADAVRAALLATYGGWWWDADTIAFRNPSCLNDQYPNASVLYTTWTKDPVRVLNGYIWFAENSSIAANWLDRVNIALEYPDQIDWTSIGEKLLTELVLNDPQAVRLRRSLLLPVDIDSHVQHFFEPKPLEAYLESDPVCFGLNHSWFMYHKGPLMSVEKWTNSPLLIHKLLTSVLPCRQK
jgi:hypothetical protein